MGLVETITLKGNAEREKYLSVLEVIDIINSHEKNNIDVVISAMDSLGLFSLTVHELTSSDPYNPTYNPIDKPICNSYELKQKIRDYRKAAGQLDNYSEGKVFDEYITLQHFIKKILWSRFDLLKIEDIAKNTSLIVWGDSNALYSMYSDMINRSDSEYYELPKSSQQAIKDYVNLGGYQREVINLVSYIPEQIICLMTNDDPARINRDDKYQAYWDMISTALDANELTPINDKEEIRPEQVKAWLAKCGFIYKNFNEYLTIEQSVQNEELQKRIAEPEQEEVDAKATGSLVMGTSAVGYGKPKTNEQLTKELAAAEAEITRLEAILKDKPADVKNSNPKDSAYCLIAVLKNLLLNPDMNAFHFKSSSINSNNKPSQIGLAEYIDDMKIYGIKKDNINILFQNANKQLTDAKKKS
ncbi:hypothetical protein [Psychrobacter sp. Sarcosine-3u-12]|uniref:hypothetical protein n=1 Tax=Psychrobacter sp. Sarcosine-3u-12 TaxID=2058325 RepID=UPI000C3288AF|nr:hypothetical protein [Psychrobacter sp. Sarcosine-3u-12]PKG35324.1 hypothetical protein CXF65_08640 [Psychrobacter sp. Sarcosine-3u-12]